MHQPCGRCLQEAGGPLVSRMEGLRCSRKTLEGTHSTVTLPCIRKKMLYTFLGEWDWRSNAIGQFSLSCSPMEILGVTFDHPKGDSLCNRPKKLSLVKNKMDYGDAETLSLEGRLSVVEADLHLTLLPLHLAAYVFPMHFFS